MIEIKVRVRPEVSTAHGGGFPPGTFDSLLQREIHQPGLDLTWQHILIDAAILDDGDAAELVLHSQPRTHPLNADQSLRVFPGTPPAYVKLLSEDGDQLHAGIHASPFHVGKQVALGEHLYEVVSEDWPGRHPETGVCAGDIDWQVCTVRDLERTSWLPSIAS